MEFYEAAVADLTQPAIRSRSTAKPIRLLKTVRSLLTFAYPMAAALRYLPFRLGLAVWLLRAHT
jgi:hypothetical protein